VTQPGTSPPGREPHLPLRERARLHWGDAVLIVIGLAAVAGFARVAGLSLIAFGLNRLVHHGMHLLWMAPLGSMLVAGLVGGLVWLLGWPIKWLRRPSVFVASIMAVTATSLALDISGLHRISAILLGLGVGVGAARIVARAPEQSIRICRRLALVASFALFASVLAMTIGSRWLEAWRAKGRPLPGPEAPNILLVILDTVRSMSLSTYGHGVPTSPALDQLAASGTRFWNAYAPAPWTTPSHASVMTGRWPFELGLDWKHGLDRTHPTLAQVLTEAGYATAGFTANFTNTSISSGIARGFTHYEDYSPSFWNVLRATAIGERITSSHGVLRVLGMNMYPGRKRSPAVTAEFLRWLDRQSGRPFFVFLNYFDAHDPYEAPPEVEARFQVRRDLVRHNLGLLGWVDWDAAQVAEQRRAYEAAIAYQDSQLQALFDGLRQRGKLENSLVIVTSDHGEEFFEHGLMFHGLSLYRPALQVPLILTGRGIPAGMTVGVPASTRSIARTVLGRVPGVDPSRFAGVDLLQLASDSGGRIHEPVFSSVDPELNTPAEFPVHHGPLYSVLYRGYRYIVDRRGVEELYALDDPAERTNLASSPDHAAALAELRERLREALRR